MAIPNDFKDYVKSTARIEEVIQNLVGNVQKRGRYLVATCPFHDDTNPSLFINQYTQTYSCNSCGAGSKSHSIAQSSDVFGFVKAHQNISFPEAVEFVAKMYNIDMPQLDPQAQERMKRHQWWVKDKTAVAQARFVDNLLNTEKGRYARDYLKDRGFDDTSIVQFGLGFGDDKDPEFTNTRNRITFPIYNTSDEIMSFTGRLPFNQTRMEEINVEREAKGLKPLHSKYQHRFPLSTEYNNIPQAYIDNHPYPKFEKSKTLYGLQVAASTIKRWHRATIVEGFTDVMRLHKHGITNAVASMGTSLSKEQCQILKNLGARTVLLMRDGDRAGIEGMERESQILKQFGVEVEVMPLREGQDPDTLGLQFTAGTTEYSRYIAGNTYLLSEWRIKRAFNMEDENLQMHLTEINQIRLRRIDSVAKALAEEKDDKMRDILTHYYAEELHVSVETLTHEYRKYIQTAS